MSDAVLQVLFLHQSVGHPTSFSWIEQPSNRTRDGSFTIYRRFEVLRLKTIVPFKVWHFSLSTAG